MNGREKQDDAEEKVAAATEPGRSPGPIGFLSYLVCAGVVLAVTLTVLDPESSRGLGLLARAAYWFSHVGIALTLLAAIQQLVLPSQPGRPTSWLSVLTAGLVGGVLFVPIALVLERLFGKGEGSNVGQALLAESIEVLPQLFLFWTLLNLPFLLRLQGPSGRPEPEERAAVPSESTAGSESASFIDRIPASLGDEILALSAELHYVRVYTPRGNALLLASLKRVIESPEIPEGIQIHRSHWVAVDAVASLARQGGSLVCRLENGLELPVSRRRSTEVKERLALAQAGKPG